MALEAIHPLGVFFKQELVPNNFAQKEIVSCFQDLKFMPCSMQHSERSDFLEAFLRSANATLIAPMLSTTRFA